MRQFFVWNVELSSLANKIDFPLEQFSVLETLRVVWKKEAELVQNERFGKTVRMGHNDCLIFLGGE